MTDGMLWLEWVARTETWAMIGLTGVLWCGGRHCLQHFKGSTRDGASGVFFWLRHLLFARMDVLLGVVVNIPWKR